MLIFDLLNLFMLYILYILYSIKLINGVYFGLFLRYNLIRLGPVGIKIGQILSHRIDFFSKDICTLLSRLTYDIPYFLNEEDLKNDMRILSKYKYWKKIGGGCIANTYLVQVNVADKVKKIVFKIKRQNIINEISLSILKFNKILKFFNFFKFDVLITEFIQKLDNSFDSLINQCDFEKEIQELEYFYEYYSNDIISIPKPYPELSNDSLIVMEYLEGKQLRDIKKHEKNEIAYNLWNFVFKSAFIEGHWHADLHKGNLVFSNNSLGIIDFGLTGKFSKLEKIAILNYTVSILQNKFLNAAKIFVNKMTKQIQNDNLKPKFIKNIFIHEIAACLKLHFNDMHKPNIIESVRQLSIISKRYGRSFNNKYVQFELAFASFSNTLMEISDISIFAYLHSSIENKFSPSHFQNETI